MMDRRQFLKTVSAGAVVAALPSAALAVAPAVDANAAASLGAFVVGTPGEFDWMHVVASNAEEAAKLWLSDRGYDETEDHGLEVERVPAWDGRGVGSVSPADWIRANLGHMCSRCDSECHPETGATVIGEDVVCEECLTLPDQVESDPEEVFDDLANRIALEGKDDTKGWLEDKGWWSSIPTELWDRAVAAGEAEA